MHTQKHRPMDRRRDRRRFRIQGVDDYHQPLETPVIDSDSDVESGASSEFDAEIDAADYVDSEVDERSG